MRVAVCEPGGRELVASDIQFNAPAKTTINLTLPSTERAPSEYERYLAILEPLLQGLSLTDIREDDEYQDITFLAGDTGLNRRRIAWVAQAAKLERETNGIPAELFYGLFRQGLSTKLNELLLTNSTILKSALERSIEDNFISDRLRDGIRGYLEALYQLRLTKEQEPSTDPASPTLKDRFGDLFTDDQMLSIAKADVEHPTLSKEWEDSLKENGFRSKDIQTIQTTYLLGGLTQNNHALGQTLRQKYGIETPGDLRNLASLDSTDWYSLAAKHGVNAEQRDLYVKTIVKTLEVSFTGAVMARDIENGQLVVSETARPILKQFFKDNPNFEFDTHYVTPFLADDGGADLTGIESDQIPVLKKELLRLDRVRKLVPRSTDFDFIPSASALLEANLDSANRIVSIGSRDFVAMMKDTLPGGEAAAIRVYDQASNNSMLAQAVISDYVNTLATPIATLSDSVTNDTIQVPDMATLFGNQDFCSCADCRSVYSPAAYFVDLLKFLWNRQPANPTLKDRLFKRRPDLGEIELTCENTNTPLPYVDLVNEILEDTVAPLSAFVANTTLPVSSISALDGRNLQQLKQANSAPPLSIPTPLATLSNDAQIEVVKLGELWTIDEPAFTYTIRAENGSVKLVTRGRQTKGSAEERGAQPQYINDRAYDVIRAQVFPWSAPFDLPMEVADSYLKHFDVTRGRLMEVFRPGDRSDILNSFEWGCAQLEIGIDEAKIITGETTGQPNGAAPGLWNLWGFSQESGSIPNPTDNTGALTGNWIQVIGGRIDALLQQSHLTYRELLDLLDTYFINPMASTGRQLSVISTDAANPDTCETDKLKLEGFDVDAAVRIVRFVRLWRRLGWSMRDLDRALTAFKPPLGNKAASSNDISANEEFLVKLAQVHCLEQNLNIPVSRLLSWWGDIDTKQYRDYTDDLPINSPSVYTQVFRGRTISNSPYTAFPEDPGQLTGNLSDHYGALATSLGLSLQDLTRLAKHLKVLPNADTPPQLDDALNLANLSRLYRHSLLAKTLRLQIRDYLILLELSESQPFVSTLDSIMFIEGVWRLREAGFSVTQLDDLLRAPAAGSAGEKLAEERAVDVLEDLRRNLRQLADEYDALDPSNDTHGDLLRQKLALLNWGASLVDDVIATLNGTMAYEAQLLSALPNNLLLPNADGPISVDLVPPQDAAVSIPAELREIVSYDAETNKLTATRFLSDSERGLLLQAAAGATAITGAFNNLFAEQDALEGEIRYDAGKPALRFIGPMTIARKARLDATPNSNQDYTDAVKALFDAPRKFILRNMPTFILRKFSEDLSGLPASVKFPVALKDRVYFDNATTPSKLYVVGALTTSEHDTLIALSTDTSDSHHSEYVIAVGKLFAQADTAPTEAPDFFLSATGIGNDASALFDQTTTAVKRFELTLTRLLPYLRRKLSEDAVVRMIAEAFQLETVAAEELLKRRLVHPDDRPSTTDRRAMAALLDPVFVNSHLEVKLSYQGFSAQFKTVTLLQKVADIVSRFKVTPRELLWLFDYGPSVGWLNLNGLPLADTDEPSLIDPLLRLVELFNLRDRLSSGETVLDELFALARDSNQIGALLERVSKLTEWSADDLDKLAGQQGLNLLDLTMPDENEFRDERAMARLSESFDLLKRLGMTAEQCMALAQEAQVSEMSANNAARAARAKYDEDRWLEIARPLRDPIREKQRAALVAYLVNHPDPAKDQHWRDVGDIYAHFLIDVEMSPCQMTSRIKQAISSTQLFVQRCLMNLEQGVASKAIDPDMWKWMKNYRVWEANRKVFLYPENWIEADLRADKTPFFRDLESQLQQTDATPENVEQALLGYLDKLEQVARLEVVSAYYHQNDLYVFARTFNTPHIYFYRRWATDTSYWTAWEQIDVAIEGDHIVPVVWMEQLYLFWLEFTEKSGPAAFKLELDSDIEEPPKHLEAQIAYSEFKSGKWSAKQLIELKQLTELDERLLTSHTEDSDASKGDVFLVVEPLDRALQMFVGSPNW
ncbi:MAG TPA: neuraminidase-like domain-containing protein [Blastocatellia bacterium]|nr:neuraminidase-like domain-containing protein [Blastocatellia bacterium]